MKCIDYILHIDGMYQGQGFPAYKWSEFDTSLCPTLGAKVRQRPSVGAVSNTNVLIENQFPNDRSSRGNAKRGRV